LKIFIGVTDGKWFDFLSTIPDIDEVNFWQPSGASVFRALLPGELFLFKLRSPLNCIVGGGFFAHSTILPLSLAWDAFGMKNGASSFAGMKSLIERYRRLDSSAIDYRIGCILLEQPFFFGREEWIPAPTDWKVNIVRGKTYSTSSEIGRALWDAVQLRLSARHDYAAGPLVTDPPPRYGRPAIIIPRLGQGSFRVLVTDAYNRRCAVTRERTLPALEAAHIKPFSLSGPHSIDNGLLLRSDLHKLLDTGYVTVTDNYRFEVSRRIREEFENGHDYYALNGEPLQLPAKREFMPSKEYLRWHNENVYLE